MNELQFALRQVVPEVALEWQDIPGTPWRGIFLDESLSSQPLSAESAKKAMESPPFWSLLWPSGHFLCRLIFAAPSLVAKRRCVDLGCGSGLLSVALGWAGGEVAAYDTDPLSRRATEMNCVANGVSCQLGDWWNGKDCDTLFLADFLYDESNLAVLEEFQKGCEEIVVVDSRMRDLPLPGFAFLGQCEGVAVPDLDPHGEFGTVRFWYAGPRKDSWMRDFSSVSEGGTT